MAARSQDLAVEKTQTDGALHARAHRYTHTHTQTHAETLVQNVCWSSTQETRCVQCWLSLLWVFVCTCVYVHARTHFSVLAPQWCNNLLTNVRTAEPLAIFHKRLKSHLFRLQLLDPSWHDSPPHVCTYCTFRWGSVCLNAFNYRIRLYESIQAVFSLFFFFNQLIGCTPSAACATQSELLYNSICSSSLASCAAKKGQKEIEWCTEVDGKHFRAVIYHISSCVFMSPPCVLYCTSQLPS